MNILRAFPRAAAVLLAVVAPATVVAATTPDSSPGPVFSSLDTNRDGALSPQEFRAGWPALQRAIAMEMALREQFRTVDANASGALEAGEYAGLVLVKQAGPKAPPLASFDADGNGALGFAEYIAVVRALAPKPAPAAAPSPGAAS